MPPDALREQLRTLLTEAYGTSDRTSELSRSRERWREGHKLLYHYTKPDGFIGIIKDRGTFWASDVRYMNDASELEYARTFIRKVCSDLRGSQVNEDWKEFIDEVMYDLEHVSRLQGPVYALCFSQVDDDLGNWRAYARTTGGYSLALDLTMEFFRTSMFDPRRAHAKASAESVVAKLREGTLAHKEAIRLLDLPSSIHLDDIMILNVIYEEERQRLILMNLLSAVYDLRRTDKNVSYLMVHVLFDVMLRFKHPSFAGEQEWRLVVLDRDVSARRENWQLARRIEQDHAFVAWQESARAGWNPLPEQALESSWTSSGPGPRYRPGNMSLVPYIEIPLARGPLGIVKVRQGPVPFGKELAADAVKRFLESKGLFNVEVLTSCVPVQF